MKYIWEEDDIVPGLIVTASGGEHYLVICDPTVNTFALVSMRSANLSQGFAVPSEIARLLTITSCSPTDYADTLEEMAKASLG